MSRSLGGGLQVGVTPHPAILYFCKNRHNIGIEKLLLTFKFFNGINSLNIKPNYENTHTGIQWKYIILLLQCSCYIYKKHYGTLL